MISPLALVLALSHYMVSLYALIGHSDVIPSIDLACIFNVALSASPAIWRHMRLA